MSDDESPAEPDTDGPEESGSEDEPAAATPTPPPVFRPGPAQNRPGGGAVSTEFGGTWHR